MKRQDTDRPSLQSILGFFALIILAIALAFIPLPGYPGGPMPDYPTRAESDATISSHASSAGSAVHGMNATGSAGITVTLINCHATGTLIIPTVAPETPTDGMIWFDP